MQEDKNEPFLAEIKVGNTAKIAVHYKFTT